MIKNKKTKPSSNPTIKICCPKCKTTKNLTRGWKPNWGIYFGNRIICANCGKMENNFHFKIYLCLMIGLVVLGVVAMVIFQFVSK